MDMNNKKDFGDFFADGTTPQDQDRRRLLGALLPEVPVESERQVLWLSVGVGALVFSGLMGWGPHGRWVNGLSATRPVARVAAASSDVSGVAVPGVSIPGVSIPGVRAPRAKGGAKAAAAVAGAGVVGAVAPTTKAAVTTVTPTTAAPVTEAASVEEVATAAPTTTVAVTTAAPTTATPTTTVAVTTAASTTATPTTATPTTATPTTATPTTAAPTTTVAVTTTAAALKLDPTVPAISPTTTKPPAPTSTLKPAAAASETATTIAATVATTSAKTADATVFFASGSSDIDESGRAVLAPVADSIAGLPSGSVVRIIGWASTDGSSARNRILSIRRARAVRAQLQQMVGARNAGVVYKLEGWGEGASAANDETKRRVTVELP
jgi:outer membrane protein OmpA-like peptidoglycan-associated protein